MYDGTLMKMINFGMHGWVIGKATLKAHPFTMNLFDVYCRGEIVNSHSHSLLFVSPCIIRPCVMNSPTLRYKAFSVVCCIL